MKEIQYEIVKEIAVLSASDSGYTKEINLISWNGREPKYDIRSFSPNREIRRRTRVVGTFPDGNSALMLVCARLRHVAGTQWGCKKYMNMKHLEAIMDDASIAG